MELSRSVRQQFCDYGLSNRQIYENQLGFFEKVRQHKFLCCVSDEFINLKEQKPDRYSDALAENIIASTEEENGLDPKFGLKKMTRQSPFRVVLQKLDRINWKKYGEHWL